MAEKKFNIVFSGKLVEGSNPPDVLNRLAMVLELDNAQVRDLFKPGAGAIIRTSLDGGTASEFLEELDGAGVICTVEGVEPAPTPAAQLSDGLEPGRQHTAKRQVAGVHTRQSDRDRQKSAVDTERLPASGAVPGEGHYGEPLVARYQPGKKSFVIIGGIFVLWLLVAGINSNEFALHLLSIALLIPGIILLVECLATRQVTLKADRVVKERWFFGESTIPASKVFMTADSAKIRFYHGSQQNLRERITVRRSMVGQEMFDRLKIAAVSRFDILLKEEPKGAEESVACQGSGAGKDRKVSAQLLGEYHKAVKDYRVALVLFSLYAIVMVFIVGLADDFNGIAKSIPDDGVRLAAILLTVASYLLLRQINPALTPAASAKARQADRLTWNERLSSAKKSAFNSSLAIINVGTGGFCLFLLTGNLLDFYLFTAVACLFYTDFYPRLSAWERLCQTGEAAAPTADTELRVPLPARRRSMQISLVLMGTLAVSAYGDSRHYLYKNRKDCLDDWGGNEQDCREPDRKSHYYRSGYWYGPGYDRTGSRATRAVGATMVSRGGFGSLGSFHASHGGGHGAS